jgi:hypothetical protein
MSTYYTENNKKALSLQLKKIQPFIIITPIMQGKTLIKMLKAAVYIPGFNCILKL